MALQEVSCPKLKSMLARTKRKKKSDYRTRMMRSISSSRTMYRVNRRPSSQINRMEKKKKKYGTRTRTPRYSISLQLALQVYRIRQRLACSSPSLALAKHVMYSWCVSSPSTASAAHLTSQFDRSVSSLFLCPLTYVLELLVIDVLELLITKNSFCFWSAEIPLSSSFSLSRTALAWSSIESIFLVFCSR